MRKRCPVRWVVCAALFLFPAISFCADTLRVLIVDGQNNHDWRSTSPLLLELLTKTERFHVDRITSPVEGEDMSGFSPAFHAYNAVVLNYTGDSWSEDTRNSFVDYVQNGGGLVVVHAANNAFGDWSEYNEIIGLGGWGGRLASAGPYVYWEDDQMVLDPSSDGPAGSHEPAGSSFVVDTRCPQHPIMRGLPEQWKHRDELYTHLRGPAKDLTILATAFSGQPKERGGSGRHEPVLFTVAYGKGRIFHTVLGHDVEAMKLPGFHVTYTRGVEWAASGDVTLAVPEDFPAVKSNLQLLTEYDGTQEAHPFVKAIRDAAEASSLQEREAMEEQLLKILEDPDVSFLAVQSICDLLGVLGTERSVPRLQRLLRREDALSHAARRALERIPGSKASNALRTSLRKTKGPSRIGIIHSLGMRQDQQAIPRLARWARRSDEALSSASIYSLGRIGTEDAVERLNRIQGRRGCDLRVVDALLMAAEQLREEGKPERARDIFEELLLQEELLKSQKRAAIRGLLSVDPRTGMNHVWMWLKDPKSATQAVGTLFQMELNQEIVLAILSKMVDLPEISLVKILGVLGVSGRSEALSSVVELARHHSSLEVRTEAIRALEGIPLDSETMEFLLGLALDPQSDTGDVAKSALIKSPGEEVEQKILLGFQDADPLRRDFCIHLATQRRMKKAVEPLLSLAEKGDSAAQMMALAALRELASSREYEQLIRLAEICESMELKREAIKAITKAGRTLQDLDQRTMPYLRALRNSQDEARVPFLGGLIYLEHPEALACAVEMTRDPHPQVQDAAYRALALWQSPKALDVLVDLAEKTDHQLYQVLLMRGFSRLLGQIEDQTPSEKVNLCARALTLGLEDGAAQLVLDALVETGGAEALDFLRTRGMDLFPEEQIQPLAMRVLGRLVGRGTWTASHGQDSMENAFDRDENTRWTTGTPMTEGMWILGDFLFPVRILRMVLDTRRSDTDYAPTLDVYLSDDPNHWTEPVYRVEAGAPVTEMDLSHLDVRSRYIKFVVASATPHKYWSIHEMSMDVEYDLDRYPDPVLPRVFVSDLLQGDGSIRDWAISDVFCEPGVRGENLLNWRFAPEVDVKLGGWSLLDPGEWSEGFVDFTRTREGQDRAIYLLSMIHVEEEMDLSFLFGSDDGVRIWLNEEQIFSLHAARPFRRDENQVSVRLKKGDNLLMVKVTQIAGNWAFGLRITLPDDPSQ